MTNPLSSLLSCACCSNRPKFPDPYQFSFDGGKQLPDNKLLF